MHREAKSDARQLVRMAPGEDLFIKYHLVELDGRERLHASKIADISCGGAKFSATEPLPVGQILKVDVISPPRQSHFQLMGQVRWCLEVDEIPTYHAGIHFVEDDGAEFAEWLQVCSDFS
ncbi:MAG: PilZ domain-containing protein [Gammaproteobacteria bacterium]|nr:PilZ domain-containing protein [Gammaproteobacteria bacterium]NVK88121.1 PilZ domain-containing protein [Gammaproteobacteria bacterium]